ncbi:hypothetical protein [Micromonospora sp. NPDC023814]|uniref:hypothetical protein n=1 Tax=Micromonospora sp. NPDC023814 TaxID=3154596 RepID=UPI0033D96DBE
MDHHESNTMGPVRVRDGQGCCRNLAGSIDKLMGPTSAAQKITLRVYAQANLDATRQALGRLDGRLS